MPAASSLLRSRRLAEYLYETELRRSGTAERASSGVRRLLASLFFWLPLPLQSPSSSLSPAAALGEDGGGGGGVTSAAPRPPGYGKLPRPVSGHEKTALSQFQANVKAFEDIRYDAMRYGAIRGTTDGPKGALLLGVLFHDMAAYFGMLVC